MTSSPCTRQGCRRVTTDPSGRCHDHRTAAPASSSRALPAPVLTERAPTITDDGEGTVVVLYGTVKRPHRLDGPARTTTRRGWVTEEWYVDGKRHREGGPAWSESEEGGRTYSEEWYFDGKCHRLDGPAWVSYTDSGEIENRKFYVLDVPVDREHLSEVLFEFTPRELRRAIEKSPFAPLLAEGVPPEKIAEALDAEVSTVEGLRAVIEGAPAEWARSFEEGRG